MTAVVDRPLTADQAIQSLRALEPELRALGIESLYLFGSTARDEAGPDSDVDLFGDVDFGIARGLRYIGLRRDISDLTGWKVDFMSRASLHPMIKDRVEADALKIY